MIRTPHFEIPYFQDGDFFSATFDEERSVTIDIILKALADVIGDGIIEGWEITDEGGLVISVSRGKGFINSLYSKTVSETEITLADDDTSFVYAIRNANLVDGISGSSNRVSVVFVDADAPDAPSDLTADSIEDRSATISWDINTEVDISYYNVYRKKTIDATFELIATIDHDDSVSRIVYIDGPLDPETSYDYEVTALDTSDNESAAATLTLLTLEDLNPPSNVANLQVVISNEAASAYWEASRSPDLDSYVVVLSELGNDGNIVSTTESNVGVDLFYVNTSLSNNTRYRITVRSLDTSGNLSVGVTQEFTPVFFNAPKEVQSISFTVSNIANPNLVTPEIEFVWTSSVSSDLSHYNIRIIDNGTEGEIIAAGNNLTKKVRFFPIRKGSVISNNSFKDNRSYIARITAVNTDGRESQGVYVSVPIPDYTRPREVANLTAITADSQISLRWESSDSVDLDHYEINYWKVSDEDSFSETIGYDSFSGFTFSLDALSSGLVNSYSVNSWVELTAPPSSGSPSIKSFLTAAASVGDLSLDCDIIPGYYNASGTIKITTPPSTVALGQETSFTATGLENGEQYRFIITSVDTSGLRSLGKQLLLTPNEQPVILNNPEVLNAEAGDTEAVLTWSGVEDIDGYKIYRAGPLPFEQGPAETSDFSLSATVGDPNTLTYLDVGLANAERYAYVVTSFALTSESDFDVNSQVIVRPNLTANPRPPENLTAISSGGTITLDWDPPSDITGVEGWNVYRSENEASDFKLIDSLPFAITTFEDKALVHGTTYYYIVKSFTNTVDFLVSVSSSPPPNSILIGRVTTESGSISSIIPVRSVISSLENTVESLTRDFVKNHKHSADISEEFDANRNQALKVNLSADEDYTNFTTSDFQTYTSQRDIVDGDFIVLLNGDIANLLFEIDPENNELVFEQPLYLTNGSGLFSEPPNIILRSIGVREVQGVLDQRFISSFDASKITSGRLLQRLLPILSHRGRILELAGVRKYRLLSKDNIFYDLNSSSYVVDGQDTATSISLGDSTLFYDFIKIDEVLYGASSRQVLKSEDNGISWQFHISFEDVITKFFESKTQDNAPRYFAVGQRKVYYSDNFTDWFEMGGLSAVNIIHGITEDSDNNVYLGTDTGLYVYDQEFALSFRFDAGRLITLGNLSSEILSITCTGGSEIIASTSEGVFATSNKGQSWTKISDEFALYKMVKTASCTYPYPSTSDRIFAIHSDGFMRSSEDKGRTWDIIDINGFTNNDILYYLDGRLFFTKDDGVFYTDDFETPVKIQGAFNRYEMFQNARAFYGVIKGDVMISFDNQVYKLLDGRTYLWSEFIGTIPSVFFNGELMKNGYFYDSINNNLFIQFKTDFDDVYEIATTYNEYLLPGGGWQDIDSDDVVVRFYFNGDLVDSVNSTDVPEENIETDEDGNIVNKQYVFEFGISNTVTVNSSDGSADIFGTGFSKFDVVRISVENVTFKDEGINTHRQIEDAIDKKDVGLPFCLSAAYLDNMLQMGLSAEHNFIESVRNVAQYPYATLRDIRSFNSELINANFFIFGRKIYDVFNSSVDYNVVQEHMSFSPNSFIINDYFEMNDETWIATDKNLFIMSSDRKSVVREVFLEAGQHLDVRSVWESGDTIYVTANDSVYFSKDKGATWEKDLGFGLPNKPLDITSVGNLLVVGSTDGAYYSRKETGEWVKAPFYDGDSEVDVRRVSSLVSRGIAYALVDNDVYRSSSGTSWVKAYSFSDSLAADKLHLYKNNVLITTSAGLYNDYGSFSFDNNTVSVTLMNIDPLDSSVPVKDVGFFENNILAVADNNVVYRSVDHGASWVKQTVSALNIVDKCHIWTEIKLTSDSLDRIEGESVPSSVVSKLTPIEDVVYEKEADFTSAVQGLLTTDEFNNYFHLIIIHSRIASSETELISALSDIYDRDLSLEFEYLLTLEDNVRLLDGPLRQPIENPDPFDKVSLYLVPRSVGTTGYSVMVTLYGADSSNTIVTGPLSSDIKSSSELLNPGWYNFRISYEGGYDRVIISVTQNYGDENSHVRWQYGVSEDHLGALLPIGEQDFSFNFIASEFENSVDEINQHVNTKPAERLDLIPEFENGSFYQTVLDEGKIKMTADPRVLSFIIDQSGSMTWNDKDGARFDLINKFAGDLDVLYPSELQYVITKYGAKVLSKLILELLGQDNDIYGSFLRIVRKEGSFPTTPLDGSIISETTIDVVKDDTVSEGTEYYYSIFNMRSDTVYSEPQQLVVTPRDRIVPLPVADLSVRVESLPETIGAPSAEVDTGLRRIVVFFRAIQNYDSFYEEVRILRKECYNEDDTIQNNIDGTIIYEGPITGGENVFIDDFDGDNDPINGVKYCYAVYTKNSLGNFCLPNNAQLAYADVPTAWREWEFDVSYEPSQIPTEFLSTPSDVENFSVESGNTQNRISWDFPSSPDSALYVALYVNEEATPEIDQLSIALEDAVKPEDSASDPEASTSNDKAGILLYQGVGTEFIHRELENDRKYFYRIVTFDRVRTASNGTPIGEGVPDEEVTDDFRPPSVSGFYAEIFNSETVFLRWENPDFKFDEPLYFTSFATTRTFALDENEAPIDEIANFTHVIESAEASPLPELDFDKSGGGESFDISPPRFVFTEDVTSFDGEIRGNLTIPATDFSFLSSVSSMSFKLHSEFTILDQEIVDQAEEASVENGEGAAVAFSLQTAPISISLRNPLASNMSNKFPETQKVARKEKSVDSLTGEAVESVVYYDGVYIRSGQSYFGEIEVNFEDAILDEEILSQKLVTIEVYDLDRIARTADGGEEKIWKQTPSQTIRPANADIQMSNVSVQKEIKVGDQTELSENTTIRTLGEFQLLPSDSPAQVIVVATVNVNGYTKRVEHEVVFQTILNVELSASAPKADGIDVAQQYVDAYIGPPRFDDKSSTPRINLPDGTVVKWQLEPRDFAKDRPFFSTEVITAQAGIYSAIRNGTATNVFFGAASDVEPQLILNSEGLPTLVGEIYGIKASVVYDGLATEVNEEVEISPLSEEDASYRFYMDNFGGTAGLTIYADGESSINVEIHSDPLITGGDEGIEFVSCLSSQNINYIPLNVGQSIDLTSSEIKTGSSIANQVIAALSAAAGLEGSTSDASSGATSGVKQEFFIYDGNEYTNAGDVPLSMDFDGIIDFDYKVNAFIGPPPKEKAPPPATEPPVNPCYGEVPVEVEYPPSMTLNAKTQSLINGNSITMLAGGSGESGLPPVVINLLEPLDIKFQKMQVGDNLVVAPPNNGIDQTDIYFETSFSGNVVPDGTKIDLELVLGNPDDENFVSASELSALPLEERRVFFGGFDSYADLTKEVSLVSKQEITSTVDSKSIAIAKVNPTRVKTTVTFTLIATARYDKLGTVKREMVASVPLTFVGSGEVTNANVFLNKVERYDPVEGVWEEIDPINKGRIGLFSVRNSITDKIYVGGGFTEAGLTGSIEEFTYLNPSKEANSEEQFGSWDDTRSEMLYQRAFAQTAIKDQKIYVMGGFGFNPFGTTTGLNAFNLVEVYDILTDTWTQLSSMPFSVSHGRAELIGDAIYVFSGLSSLISEGDGHTIGSFNNKIMKYDILTDTWTTLTDLGSSNLLKRVAPGSYVKSGMIYVFGGADNQFDPDDVVSASFPYPLVEIDLTNEANIVISKVPFTNNPINRYRFGAAELIGDKIYASGGSGVKTRTISGVERKFASNTLRALEIYDTTTDTWTVYTDVERMTYERHSLAATTDADFFYAIAGAGSGFDPGKLFLEMSLSDDQMRADGRDQISATVNMEDATGEPPPDGVKINIRGFVVVPAGEKEDLQAVEGTEGAAEQVQAVDPTDNDAIVDRLNDRVSVYPVVFSATELFSIDGSSSTIILERSEDPLVALEDLVDFRNGSDLVVGLIYDEETGSILVPKRSGLSIVPNEVRQLYSIIVEAVVEDDFFFGATNTDAALSGLSNTYANSLFGNEIEEGEVDVSDLGQGSLSSPQPQEQAPSPVVSVYNDITWYPFVFTDNEIYSYSEFVDRIELISQEIPFGGSPHYDAIVETSQNVLKQDEIIDIEKLIIDVADNEENLSTDTVETAVDQVHLIKGFFKTPVFVNSFVVAFPPSLAARRGQSDTVNLERLSGDTGGISNTVLDPAYVNPVVRTIKTSAIGSIGRGTYQQTVDLEQRVIVTDILAKFNLFDYTNGLMEIYYSNDGANFTRWPFTIEADVSTSVNIEARYIRFVAILTTEFGDPTGTIPAPPPEFCEITITYSLPTEQFIYTFAEEANSFLRELAITSNATIPVRSSISLGVTNSSSTNWLDYQNKHQPAVNERGRIVVLDNSLSTLNLVSDISAGGNTSLSARTYSQIESDFISEKEDEYGKKIDKIVVIEPYSSASTGQTEIYFADGSTLTINEAPDYTQASDIVNAEGASPTLDVTEGTVLNYNFLKSEDGFIFVSPYGPWQPEATVNVYKNGILVNKSEYVEFQHMGIIKFNNRQKIDDSNYALETALSPKYRIGIKIVNRDHRQTAVLDEFAYMYNTNFVKSSDFDNSFPTASNLSISPVNALPTDTFIANYTFSDPDNDQERGSEITWYLNGGPIAEVQNKTSWSDSDLTTRSLKDGDKLYFTVRPNDGTVFGPLVSSPTTVLGGRPPVASDLNIAYSVSGAFVTEPTSAVDLIAQYVYSDSEGRAESGTIVEWFLNDNPIEFDSDDPKIVRNQATVQPDGTPIIVRGNVIKFRVIPSNGITQGEAVESAEVIIENSLPVLTNVRLEPEAPTPTSIVTIEYDFFDQDDDEDLSVVKWYKNGVEQTDLEGRASISASQLVIGDQWFADIEPNDGFGLGETIRTSTITVVSN
jgi:hypothetical protein